MQAAEHVRHVQFRTGHVGDRVQGALQLLGLLQVGDVGAQAPQRQQFGQAAPGQFAIAPGPGAGGQRRFEPQQGDGATGLVAQQQAAWIGAATGAAGGHLADGAGQLRVVGSRLAGDGFRPAWRGERAGDPDRQRGCQRGDHILRRRGDEQGCAEFVSLAALGERDCNLGEWVPWIRAYRPDCPGGFLAVARRGSG